MTATDLNGERRISAILDDLLEQIDGEHVTLDRLIEPLHERAFGLVMLIFILPNCLPMPGIPFVSTLTGIPIMALAGQLIAGRHSPFLPAWLARKQMRRAAVARAWARIRPAILWLERLVGPRYGVMTSWRMEQAMGGMIGLLALILAMPIFGGNLLPAWGVLLMALAIVERDGLVALAGWAMALVALIWTAVLLYFGTQLLMFLWAHAREWLNSLF